MQIHSERYILPLSFSPSSHLPVAIVNDLSKIGIMLRSDKCKGYSIGESRGTCFAVIASISNVFSYPLFHSLNIHKLCRLKVKTGLTCYALNIT